SFEPRTGRPAAELPAGDAVDVDQAAWVRRVRQFALKGRPMCDRLCSHPLLRNPGHQPFQRRDKRANSQTLNQANARKEVTADPAMAASSSGAMAGTCQPNNAIAAVTPNAKHVDQNIPRLGSDVQQWWRSRSRYTPA